MSDAVMLERISVGILDHFEKSGIEVGEISFKQLVDRQTGGTRRPKINVSIDSGSHRKVTMNTYKQIPIVSLYILVQNLRGEGRARFGVYKLLDSIMKSLVLQKLDLPLQDPFIPVSFNNVTDEDFAGAGYSVYQMDFTCSFNYTHVLDDLIDQGELLQIVNEYVNDTETMGGIVDLSDVDGGGSFSDHIEEIDGGKAGTDDFVEDINGGDANSTYGN